MVDLVVQTDAGVAGANVYDDLDAWIGYLEGFGFTNFTSRTPDQQRAFAVRATRLGEDKLRRRLDQSRPVDPSQRLLFPRLAAVDAEGNAIVGLPSLTYRQQGLMELGDALAGSGTSIPTARRPGVRSERDEDWSITYTADDITFEEEHENIWMALSSVLPHGGAIRVAKAG